VVKKVSEPTAETYKVIKKLLCGSALTVCRRYLYEVPRKNCIPYKGQSRKSHDFDLEKSLVKQQ
jgi:hypothetical protein